MKWWADWLAEDPRDHARCPGLTVTHIRAVVSLLQPTTRILKTWTVGRHLYDRTGCVPVCEQRVCRKD
jgi:hypothetical protein